MLKKFFISMLGTMAALWLSLLILFIGAIFAVGILISKSAISDINSDGTVLYIDLTGSISDRASSMSFSDIMSVMDESADDLETILTSVKKASEDKNIKGIYIYCGGSEMGVASRSELISQLKKFREKGKWVYAYADNFTQGDYYVATAADKVFLNPVGMLDVHGFGSTVMFYKDLLDKLGIDVEVVRVGTYKSAVEPYMRMDMSEASRKQTEVYLNQIWDNVTSDIVSARSLKDASVVNAWADSIIATWAPEKYVEQKAVDKLCYRNEAEDIIRELISHPKDKDLPLITPTEYLELKAADLLKKSTKKHIAVLYAVGDITESDKGGIVSDEMVPKIYELMHNDKVSGMVLRVNSPGGSAFASEQIWHALEDFKASGRPLYVSMGDYAASGGYYISCGADKIYCDPATITGSIGIFGIIPNAEKLLKDKVGLGFSTVETNPNATFPSLFIKPTADQIAAMQREVERGYETFTSRVAQGRNISVDSVKAIGSGRVWDGMSALKIGLVDELGTLEDAIAAMADNLKLKADDYVSYPEVESNILQSLIRQSSKNIEVSVEGIPAKDVKQYYDYIERLKNLYPVQMRMEPIILQ